ncbi:pyruvate kinase [Clostridia bacterium]|nr:pyruvate kinase [Clostridia bacterium]
MRRTKIICTLGPAVDEPALLEQLMREGMDVARINFSHGTYEEHDARIARFRAACKATGMTPALLLDTKGPEIRTGNIKGGGKITLENGQKFTLTNKEIEGDSEIVYQTYPNLAEELKPGDRVLIDDGLIGLTIESVGGGDVVCRVDNGGEIGSHKGINIPNVSIKMEYLSEKDIADINYAVDNGFDFIAASFVRSAEDVLDIRRILESRNCNDIDIIAKIENREGVTNSRKIIRVSDGLMVARGDLGVEIPLEEVPVIQKKLIRECYREGKRVITATQMLDSMQHNPRPTRAETTDVANAIYDGTSAIMLSGETAAGKYPIEAVRTMSRIAEYTENNINYKRLFMEEQQGFQINVTNAISHATCTTAHDLGAAAIVTITNGGSTARMVSRFRPACPIIAVTPSEKTYRQLKMSWGVYPIMGSMQENSDELFAHAVAKAEETGLAQKGDIVVITGGTPLGISGTTNTLKVELVGNVLVSGNGIGSSSLTGTVFVSHDTAELAQYFETGSILVIDKTDNALLPIIKRASALIVEADGVNSHAATVGLTLGIPTIVGAQNATKLLRSGTVVSIDTAHGYVYAGNSLLV